MSDCPTLSNYPKSPPEQQCQTPQEYAYLPRPSSLHSTCTRKLIYNNQIRIAVRADRLAGSPEFAWKDVKDFKWHRTQASPNWGLLPEDQWAEPVAPEAKGLVANTLCPSEDVVQSQSGEAADAQQDDDDEEDEL